VQLFDDELKRAINPEGREVVKVVKKENSAGPAESSRLCPTGISDKRTVYKSMVTDRKKCRACMNSSDSADDLINAATIANGIYDCDQIGAFTQWQSNLDANLMVVAQDFGDVDWFIKEKGRPTSINPSPTNKALVDLLNNAGFPINLANETVDVGDLFFTNAVLCMKQGGTEAPIKQEWLTNCSRLFLRPLIELVHPKVVVALGTQAYQSVLTAYRMIARVFRQAVDSGKPDSLPNDVQVFPVYHCGWRGQSSRPLEQQREDWKRIGSFLRQSLREEESTDSCTTESSERSS
jgi:DNA polymerase